MATITKKKALANFQGADQANNLNQQNLGLIRDTKVNPFTTPTTPKLDTNSVIASQLNTPADIFKQKYANQGMTTPVVTTPITPVAQKALSSFQVNGGADVAKTEAQANAGLIPSTPKLDTNSVIASNTSTPTTSGPTNQQNMDALTANVATVAENAKRKSDEQKSELKYGAQQRDYKLDSIKATADTDQMRLDRQMADQTLQVDRAIADTDRISKRNIAMVEKVAALQGTGKSSGFGQGMLNLKEDTIRTIDRLKEDLDRAKTASGEEAKLLWENYNRNKEKIDNDFEYQFRDFTNRQTASIAELTTAGYDPVKVNKALGKIYEEAQYKTQELFTNYVNNSKELLNMTNMKSQELRTQEEFNIGKQKEFISQYIGYNGERLASQTLTDLKGYLDNGQISKNDYDLYTKMIGDNTIATLQQHGTVTEDDLANIEQLLKIGYTPTKAVAYMIQSNPTRFTPQESKAPNIQTYEVNGEKYSGYFDQSGNFVNMSAPGGGGVGSSSGLLDYISSSEGTHGNYNAMYGKGSQTAINLTGMTINQIQDLQKKSVYKDKNGNYVGGAMGKYQIVTGTLNGLKQRLGLTGNELFDEAMQDKMAMALIGSSYDDYQAGKITAEQLQKKVSGIWAGVPNPATGKSTYAADGTNKARADNGEFLAAVGSPGQAQGGDLNTLGQYMKDNQQRGPGYSEEDVKAFNEKIDRFVKNGDKKGIALAFRTNLFQDKDLKQEFDNTKKFTTALDTVQKLIKDYSDAGKSTNALKGMAEKVARSMGITTDQALAQLQTQMGFTLAGYIKSISGTAASDAEVQRLMGQMANISNVKDLNDTIVNQVRDNANTSLKSMIDTRMYGMPDDLKYSVFEDVYGKQQMQSNKQQSNIPAGLANPGAVQGGSVDDPLGLR